MGILNVKVDDILDREFRLEIVRRYNGRKGAIQKGVEEAIRLFLGPIYVQDLQTEKAENYIKNMKDLLPDLTYFPGLSRSGKDGYVGMYYTVLRKKA